MKIRWIALIYTVAMLVMLKFLIGSFGQDDFSKRDMVYYNDIIEQVKDSYYDGIAVEDIEKQCKCEIILNDDPEYMARLYEYYGDYGLVVDLAPDSGNDVSIGKICFASEENAFSLAKDNVRRNIIYVWIALLAAGYIFIFILYYNYIRPFHELEHFSGEIAKGNLDVALPMHRTNIFGAYTESFDVMREEIAASKMREAKAEKSKKELVAQLSHDIKTPVATIKATCEVLEMQEKMRFGEIGKKAEKENDQQDGNISAEERNTQSILEKLGYISNKADTIDELISNMFQATLEELEELDVKPVETDSRAISHFFDELSSFGNIIVENELPECLVYMDELRMEQVIGNIIGNSAKYAGTDITVTYRVREIINAYPPNTLTERDTKEKIDKESYEKDISSRGTGEKDNNSNNNAKNQYLCITIRDYGKGIPDEDLDKVTEKFYRGQNAAGKQGSGLGLYLSKVFMEMQMGGFECYNHKSVDEENDGFVSELYLKKV